MKLTVVLLLSACLQISAKGVVAQNIHISERNASLEKILNKIEEQTDYRFVYTDVFLQKAKPATLVVSDATIEEALDICFKDEPFTYTIINNLIVIKQRAASSGNPPGENIAIPPVMDVSGIVTDKDGHAVSGASVLVKGSTRGTTSDAKGGFTLHSVAQDAVLLISFTGYKTVEVPVRGRSGIEVQLELLRQDLNEVVVVGYGTQKKVNLTGAVATVGAERLDSRPIVNLGDGLEGLIPNLTVTIPSGQPGTNAVFNVRGLATLSNGTGSASPLILIDGVARDPNLIDPNDVASVTVLKDAAAAAIYGGRAAYGVILITTKRGKKGLPRLSYSGSYTTSRPTNLPKYVNSLEYLKIFNNAQRTGAATGGRTAADPFTPQDSVMINAYYNDPAHNPDAYADPGNPSMYRYVGNTDWIKVLYPGWAPMQQHNLSLSGGEGKTTYIASMGYLTQDGLEKVAHQVFNRYTPSLKLNTEVNKWLSLNLDISLTHTDNNQGAEISDGVGGAAGGGWMPGDLKPIMPVYNPDGHFSGQGNTTNPVAVLDQSGRDIDHKNDLWTTARIILTPINHLTITSDYTWNSYTEFDKANLIPYNEYGVDGAFLDIFPYTNPARVIETRQNNNYMAFNAYATYENTFSKKNYVKVLVGYNQEYQHYQLSNSTARNLIDPTLPAIGVNNDTKPSVGGTETEYALLGQFFRVNYVYDERYLLEINGRYDGTSRFQPSDRFAFSPSISAGWNIAKESFMKRLNNTIDELKLRASYGQLPNQLAPSGAISSNAQYPYIATMPTGSVSYLFNNQPGVTVGAPGLISPTFTWEKVQTKNFGLDYAFLDTRLSGSMDYFITDTKDLLVGSQQLPAVLGTSAPPTNSAALQTKGWELSATWKDRVLNKKLFYSITVGLSDNTTTVTKYAGNPTQSLSDLIQGQKMGNIYGFVTQGFYKTDAEAAAVNNTALAGYTWLAGDIKYADLNHDGKIDYGNNTLKNLGDQKVIGNSTPRYKFGVNLNLSYKGFDFAAFVQGQLKQDFNPTGSKVFNAFQSAEWDLPFKYAMDYWTPTNTNAYFARPRFAGSGDQKAQTKYIQSAAYARLKQLTLGYNVPGKLLTKMRLQNVRIYATAENLFKVTPLFKGFDPELLNYMTYPLNRSISFGLQVTL